MRASSFSPGAPQSHPLASFLNRSSDGLNSQAEDHPSSNMMTWTPKQVIINWSSDGVNSQVDG
eukprot:1009183-Pelagomonas_calceolata.AAC.1